MAQLGSLKAYYVPTNIPEEYRLYSILAGVSDICFAYYPVEVLGDEAAMMDGAGFFRRIRVVTIVNDLILSIAL